MKSRAGHRFVNLVGLSAQIAGKMASHSGRKLFSSAQHHSMARSEMLHEIGSELARTLGEMKGAAMKVGQIASQMKDLFPEEIAHELEILQKHAPPMDYAVIAECIKTELGEEPDTLFAEFEPSPCAAASIGQVHRACLHSGERVVVKVQYPGVRESCESDLKHLKRLFSLIGLLKLDERMLNDVFDEVRRTLLAELDYEMEAQNLLLFRDYYANDPSVIIPRFFQRYSSRCVLTMSEEAGCGLKEVDTLGLTAEQINQIGKRLFRLIFEQIFDLQALHADPHPGNFAIQTDGRLV
ncbi:MAG: AarF/ABC1/UbiB kinase family protein, partial [Gammaproteobacteria bacterium]